MNTHHQYPGSDGEHSLQHELGTTRRAHKFYSDQMSSHLNDEMIEFIGRMDMAFIATADAKGEADSSFRAGPPGFIQVLDAGTVCYPEYRGNGVMASLGNITENPNVGIMLIDFVRDRIGLHINGRATIVPDDELREQVPDLPEETVPGRVPELWVKVDIHEAYIHCRKHIPAMVPADHNGRAWGTDNAVRKGGDYFGVTAARREAAKEAEVGKEAEAAKAAVAEPNGSDPARSEEAAQPSLPDAPTSPQTPELVGSARSSQRYRRKS